VRVVARFRNVDLRRGEEGLPRPTTGILHQFHQISTSPVGIYLAEMITRDDVEPQRTYSAWGSSCCCFQESRWLVFALPEASNTAHTSWPVRHAMFLYISQYLLYASCHIVLLHPCWRLLEQEYPQRRDSTQQHHFQGPWRPTRVLTL
jgi:hypothetical protein